MADCHVELAALEAIESLATVGVDWLTAAERQRLEAITAPLRRRQFLAGHWLVRDAALRSQGKSTPFSGYELPGRVLATVVGGHVAFEA